LANTHGCPPRTIVSAAAVTRRRRLGLATDLCDESATSAVCHQPPAQASTQRARSAETLQPALPMISKKLFSDFTYNYLNLAKIAYIISLKHSRQNRTRLEVLFRFPFVLRDPSSWGRPSLDRVTG
jgi:hypothetical protein